MQMLNNLKRRFPSARVQQKPDRYSEMIWFYIDNEAQYIGIPLVDLTYSEAALLKSLFPHYFENMPLNHTSEAKQWHDYLFGHEITIPLDEPHSEYRVIQFSISQNNEEDFDRKHWEEAIKSLFPREIVILFHTKQEGAIIEEKHDSLLSEQELATFIQALESDFYVKIHFYVGQFKAVAKGLKVLFQLEQNLYRFARQEIPQDRLFSLNHVFLQYLLKNTPIETRNTLFSSIYDVLKDEPELWKTITLYLENHSNTSLTAKQLFMHRNSLQYRIDKFVEKTGYDLKSFSSSMIVYLACLDFLSQADDK